MYVTARMFAYFFDFKDPRFVVGFNDPEMDVAINNGELDARTSGNIDSVLKDLGNQVQFHATISNPKGRFDQRLPGLADIDTFAKNDKERKVVDLLRAFQVPRWPHHLSPGTPPELVKICAKRWRRLSKILASSRISKNSWAETHRRSPGKKWRRRSGNYRATSK